MASVRTCSFHGDAYVNHRCPTCRRDYNRDFRKAHAPELSAYIKEWRKNSPVSDTDRRKDWAKRNPSKYRAGRLANYGLTLEAYNELFEKQDKRCAICRTDKPVGRGWMIDHNHDCCPSGRSCGACVRGILCHGCNTGLGMFKDSPEALNAAIDYVAWGQGQVA